jgi:hypothetical protein
MFAWGGGDFPRKALPALHKKAEIKKVIISSFHSALFQF